MEHKGLSLEGLDKALNKTNKSIKNINKEVESLLED